MRGKNLYKFVIILLFAVGFVNFSPNVRALEVDSDADSIVDVVEDEAALNSGDNNYDGIQDSYQNTVATIENPNDVASPNAPVSLQLGEDYTYPCGEFQCSYTTSDWKIDEFKAVDPATLPSQPDGKVFPLGMFSMKLSCHSESECYEYDEGCYLQDRIQETDNCVTQIPAKIKLIFDRVVDTSNWTMLKYDPSSNTYVDYSEYVTISNQEIGFLRTVIEWSIYDGGFGDADGEVNGYISDPIGPTIPVATTTSTLVVPTTQTTTVTSPTLANTGFATNVLISIAVLLIAASVIIFPKKRSEQ